MPKGTRLDIADPKVVELLKRHVDKKTGLSVYDAYKKDLLSQRVIPGPEVEKGREGNDGVRNLTPDPLNKGKFNTKGHIDATGAKWDSKWEYQVYCDLEFLRQCKIIDKIELKPKFDFVVNDYKICTAELDFAFWIDDTKYIADAKSRQTSKTRGWTLIKKMLRAFYLIDVVVFYQEEKNVKEMVYKLKKG